MILVIRIKGMVKIPSAVQETLFRMRLRRKYASVLIKDNKENRSLLEKVRNFVAYGEINPETLEKLIDKRAVGLKGKKFDAKTVIAGLAKKGAEEVGIKPFFRLHPPRGGIDAKLHAGIRKGVLGNNKEAINQLVERML